MVDRINNNIQQNIKATTLPSDVKQKSTISFFGKVVSLLLSSKKDRVMTKSDQTMQTLNNVRNQRDSIKERAAAITELVENKAISGQETFRELINLKKEIKVLNQKYLEAHVNFSKSLNNINKLSITALKLQGRFKKAGQLEKRFGKSSSKIQEEGKEALNKFEAGLTKDLINHTDIIEKHIKSLFNRI